jgi:hypothetical protein
VADDKLRNESTDRLLRQTFAVGAGDVTPACVDAEVLAGWVEGALSAPAARSVEAHLSSCERCQSVLATLSLAQSEVAGATPPATPARFWQQWSMKWLAPVAAGLGAVIVWALVRPDTTLGPPTSVARVEESDKAAAPEAVFERDAPPGLTAGQGQQQPAAAAAKMMKSVSAEGQGRQQVSGQAPAAVPPQVGVTASAPVELSVRRDNFSTFRALPPNAVPSASAETDARARQVGAAAPAEAPRAENSVAVVGGVTPVQTQSAERVVTLEQQPAAPAPFVRGTPTFPEASTVAVEFGVGAQPTIGFASRTNGPPLGAAAGRGGGGGRAVGAPAAPAPPPPGSVADARVEAPAPRGTFIWRVLVTGRVERQPVGSVSWSPVELPQATFVAAGASPSTVVCWLVGRGGLVLRSTDGETFVRVTAPVSADLVSVTATSALAARVVTADGRAFATTDGGATWR